MNWQAWRFRWWVDLFRRRQSESELKDELQSHIHLETLRRMNDGESAESAQANALREVRSMTWVKEATREAWSWASLETVLQDLRYGMRCIATDWRFSGIAIVLLALGIGANTAIFSVFDQILLRSLPVRKANELALVRLSVSESAGFRSIPRLGSGFVSLREFLGGKDPGFDHTVYRSLRNSNKVFSDLLALTGPNAVEIAAAGANGGNPETVRADIVSGNFFSVLGVEPVFGRLLSPDNDKPSETAVPVVLSYRFWKRRFGVDPNILGRVLYLNGAPFMVAGIVRPGFDGVSVGDPIDLWISLADVRALSRGKQKAINTDSLTLIGRLKPGVTEEQAAEALRTFQPLVATSFGFSPENYPQSVNWFKFLVSDGSKGISALRTRYSDVLKIAMGSMSLLLLITCASLATLALSRTIKRRREIAVRLALGASRSRIMRQLLTESLLLASIGGTAGFLLSQWGASILIALLSGDSSDMLTGARIEAPIFVFSAATTLLAVILFGLAPALHGTRLSLNEALNQGSNPMILGVRAGRMRANLLVFAQVVLSVVLVVGASLFLRTITNLAASDAGFSREQVLFVRFESGNSVYRGAKLAALAAEIERKIRALPGVLVTSVATHIPFDQTLDTGSSSPIQVPGYTRRPGDRWFIPTNLVGTDFFRASGIPILEGRAFGPSDGSPESIRSEESASAPTVAVVNETFVRRFLNGQDAVGKHFTMRGVTQVEIVGVAKDAKYENLREQTIPIIYLPAAQNLNDWRQLSILVRLTGTAREAVPLAAAIRSEAMRTTGDMRVAKMEMLRNLLDRSVIVERFAADLSGFAGALSLLLVSIGLYGMVSSAVASRTQELGIRIALGAQRKNVINRVLAGPLLVVCSGIVAGVPLALALTQLISSILFGVGGADPLTFGAAAILMILSTLAAGLFPALRASRIDPIVALRYE